MSNLFDSAIDRKRIEPTPKETLNLKPDERKAVSDIFMDFPTGFAGETLLVEVDYKSGGKEEFSKVMAALHRKRDAGVGGAGGGDDIDPRPADPDSLAAKGPKYPLAKEPNEGGFAIEANDHRFGAK